MKLRKIISLILILSLALNIIGCSLKCQPIYTGAEFDAFTDKLFVNEVQGDSLTLNYTIAQPENYGITDFKPTFGTYSLKDMKNGNKLIKKYIKELEKFDYNTLSDSQKVTYDIIYKYFNDHLCSDKMLLYREDLSPTSGVQAIFPVLLAEYHFHKKQDVNDYIALINQIGDYFKQVIEFQKQKAKAGLFMSDTTVDAVIAQCKDFIGSKEDNYMITMFNNRVETFTALSQAEKQVYKDQNRDAILNSMIPAYEMLITELTALKGSGKNPEGLCHFKKGKDYYEYLVRNTTGSSRSMKEINKLLDEKASESLVNIATVVSTDEQIQTKLDNYYYPLTDPDEILEYLQKAIVTDFPPLNEVNCTIKAVDKSMENYLSPAFYLTPQLDDFSKNSIYINHNKKYDLSEIFTTIAHEGYPGHLYQNCYYNQQKPSLIRHIINFEGYSEGWATYVENYSYSIAGLDEQVAKVLANNSTATLCIYGKCDLNINYYGWDLDATKEYLKGYGITDDAVATTIFNRMIQEPCSYLKYTLGYLELASLRKNAEDRLGDNFSPINFHKFVLDMGPCQFSVLEKYMDQWMTTQQ